MSIDAPEKAGDPSLASVKQLFMAAIMEMRVEMSKRHLEVMKTLNMLDERVERIEANLKPRKP